MVILLAFTRRTITFLASRVRNVLCAAELSQFLGAVTCGRRQVMQQRGCGRGYIVIRGEEGCREHSRCDQHGRIYRLAAGRVITCRASGRDALRLAYDGRSIGWRQGRDIESRSRVLAQDAVSGKFSR